MSKVLAFLARAFGPHLLVFVPCVLIAGAYVGPWVTASREAYRRAALQAKQTAAAAHRAITRSLVADGPLTTRATDRLRRLEVENRSWGHDNSWPTIDASADIRRLAEEEYALWQARTEMDTRKRLLDQPGQPHDAERKERYEDAKIIHDLSRESVARLAKQWQPSPHWPEMQRRVGEYASALSALDQAAWSDKQKRPASSASQQIKTSARLDEVNGSAWLAQASAWWSSFLALEAKRWGVVLGLFLLFVALLFLADLLVTGRAPGREILRPSASPDPFWRVAGALFLAACVFWAYRLPDAHWSVGTAAACGMELTLVCAALARAGAYGTFAAWYGPVEEARRAERQSRAAARSRQRARQAARAFYARHRPALAQSYPPHLLEAYLKVEMPDDRPPRECWAAQQALINQLLPLIAQDAERRRAEDRAALQAAAQAAEQQARRAAALAALDREEQEVRAELQRWLRSSSPPDVVDDEVRALEEQLADIARRRRNL